MVCEDGTQIEVHKVVLSTSSPMLQNMLRRNKHTHPLIYMRGMKSRDLLAILDFLYCGEANVFQEDLDSFLAVAEELQLKGLMEKSEDQGEKNEEVFPTTGPVNRARSNSKLEKSKERAPRVDTAERVVAIKGDLFEDFWELGIKVYFNVSVYRKKLF